MLISLPASSALNSAVSVAYTVSMNSLILGLFG